jgi:hypothetical protein
LLRVGDDGLGGADGEFSEGALVGAAGGPDQVGAGQLDHCPQGGELGRADLSA